MVDFSTAYQESYFANVHSQINLQCTLSKQSSTLRVKINHQQLYKKYILSTKSNIANVLQTDTPPV